MMLDLRWFLLLLALLSGGLAHASYSLDGAPRASDEELDRMRGGFVVSWNGLEFVMPFSITGIERLTQAGGQTYLNGELMSPRLNPQALIPISQLNQISVSVQTQASELASSGSGGGAVGGDSTSTGGRPAASSVADSGKGPAADGVIGTAGTQVTTHGSSYIIQVGAANTVVLPSGVSLDSLATFIQNSVNNQVIRNITTMNITIEAQQLAAQARLNSILNQSLNGLR